MAKNNSLNTHATSAVLVTGSAGNITATSTMTNGQIVIGSTGSTPTAATLTAGSGITITNGPGSIAIAASGGGSGRLLNVRYLTGSGTYIPTTGTQSIYVIACGGGGGSSGTYYVIRPSAFNSFYCSCGDCGGGAATGFKFYSSVSSVTGTSYSVGAGGSAGLGGTSSSIAPTYGGVGGSTTFANGDMNLAGGTASPYAARYYTSSPTIGPVSGIPGATKNTGDNSDFVINGTPVPPLYTAPISQPYSLMSGASYLSPGAIMAGISAAITPSGYGGGSVGAVVALTPSSSVTGMSANGAPGAPGVIIVYEYGS